MNREDDGGCLFRCMECHRVIDDVWGPIGELPTGDRANNGTERKI